MKVVSVDLGDRSYDIEISADSLEKSGAALFSLGSVSRVVLITDDNVYPLYAEKVANSIVDRGLDLDVVVIPAGEESKSIDVAYSLWERFLEIKLDRKSVVVALGGGVVGDLAGFVAATYVRGVRFFQIPTTLLAQVDSSVGGKTAIDLPNGKNMVGAFHQPQGVLIDPLVLRTLSSEQYLAGLGEVVKYGISLDADFFEFLEKNAEAISQRDSAVLGEIIAWSCRIKADIVRRDERETLGLRALLNYGHSFGHSLETAVGYGKLLHGFAVTIGCSLIAKLARNLARQGDERFQKLDDRWFERQNNLLKSLGLPTCLDEVPNLEGEYVTPTPEQLVALASTDKKNDFGKMNLVLPTALGESSLIRDVDVNTVLDALKS